MLSVSQQALEMTCHVLNGSIQTLLFINLFIYQINYLLITHASESELRKTQRDVGGWESRASVRSVVVAFMGRLCIILAAGFILEVALESYIVTLNENDFHHHLNPQLGSVHQAFHELLLHSRIKEAFMIISIEKEKEKWLIFSATHF